MPRVRSELLCSQGESGGCPQGAAIVSVDSPYGQARVHMAVPWANCLHPRTRKLGLWVRWPWTTSTPL